MSEPDPYRDQLERIYAAKTLPMPGGLADRRAWDYVKNYVLHFIDPEDAAASVAPAPPDPPEPEPAAPTLTSLDPATIAVGNDFTLHVYGTGFTGDSTILWDGLEVITTYVTTTELTTAVSLGLEEAARPVSIAVETKMLPTSNVLAFTVTLPESAP